MVQLVPLTAVRCDSPAVRKSSASAGSSALVSPSAKPGSRPRGPSGQHLGGISQARADPAGRRSGSTGGGLDLDRRAPGRQHRHREVPAQRRCQPAVGPQLLAGQQTRAIRPPGRSTSTRPGSRPAASGRSRHARTSAATATRGGPEPERSGLRVLRDHEAHGDARALDREVGQRRALGRGQAAPRWRAPPPPHTRGAAATVGVQAPPADRRHDGAGGARRCRRRAPDLRRHRERGQNGQPSSESADDEPQVGRPVAATASGPPVTPAPGRAAGTAATSPMPGTSASWSTVANRPCSVRQSRIRCASTGPTPGSVSSCASVAVLRSIAACAPPPGEPPGAPPAAPAGWGSRISARHADHHQLAVGQLAGQVEQRQVGARQRSSGGPQRVDDPRAGGQRDDPGSPHPAGHRDDERGGRRPPDTPGELGDAATTGGGATASTWGRPRQTRTETTNAAASTAAVSAAAPRRPGSTRAARRPSGAHRSANRRHRDCGRRSGWSCADGLARCRPGSMSSTVD